MKQKKSQRVYITLIVAQSAGSYPLDHVHFAWVVLVAGVFKEQKKVDVRGEVN